MGIQKRDQAANTTVARKCIGDPWLLGEIVAGLSAKDVRIAGDCAEVMTQVAELEPELVAPHARELLGLLGHKNGRVRWESAHALGLAAHLAPAVLKPEVPRLAEIVRKDGGVIVRDYVLDALAGYGSTSERAAGEAWPVLEEALGLWESRHAGRILRGLRGLLAAAPGLAPRVRRAAERFEAHPRAGIRKEARALLKAIDRSAAAR